MYLNDLNVHFKGKLSVIMVEFPYILIFQCIRLFCCTSPRMHMFSLRLLPVMHIQHVFLSRAQIFWDGLVRCPDQAEALTEDEWLFSTARENGVNSGSGSHGGFMAASPRAQYAHWESLGTFCPLWHDGSWQTRPAFKHREPKETQCEPGSELHSFVSVRLIGLCWWCSKRGSLNWQPGIS